MVQTQRQRDTGVELRLRWVNRHPHWNNLAWVRRFCDDVRTHIASLHVPSGANADAIARWREREDALETRITFLGG